MKDKTAPKNPLEAIPDEIKKKASRVGKAAAKGLVEGAANELVKIIDEIGKPAKKKKARKDDWG
jgi:hypothetical protein